MSECPKTTATEQPPAMAWVGWYRTRTGSRWRRACQGATLDECARRLDAATRTLRLRCTDVVMTGGGYPNLPPYPAAAAPPKTRKAVRP